MSTNRCNKCNYRSIFLTKCKCGNSYCTKDRLPEIHNCTEKMHMIVIKKIY